ncbi:MAG: LysR family transcriptional regulator [Bacteriovoracaceae bacterium]|jgi:DNA-binding transcriptional LysR family regulator|nr:LysR family transcriptional regulator [Bacteriovoracaceae bacterium]
MSYSIDYRYLKAFQLTAKYLNFSKAASELNIAQSAVSRQIKLLEESMNEQLIVRSSKKVLLTEKGKSLLRAIGQFEDMTNELANSDGPSLIRIGILHGLLESWFIKVIKEFSHKFDHELKIVTDTPSNMKQDLIDGKLDLIFTTENIQSDLVTSLRLFEEKLVIVSKKSIDTKTLHNYTWITYGESDFFFKLSKKHSSRIIMVKSMTAITKLVKEGVGIAVVPSHSIQGEKLKEYEVKGIKNPQIYLSTLNFQSLPGYIEELVNIIKKNS